MIKFLRVLNLIVKYGRIAVIGAAVLALPIQWAVCGVFSCALSTAMSVMLIGYVVWAILKALYETFLKKHQSRKGSNGQVDESKKED